MYCVMGRENSGSLAKESENVQSEVVMRKAVDSIQTDVERDPKAHRDAIQKLQRDNWNNRWRKVRGAVGVGVGNGVGMSKGVDEVVSKSMAVGAGTHSEHRFPAPSSKLCQI